MVKGRGTGCYQLASEDLEKIQGTGTYKTRRTHLRSILALVNTVEKLMRQVADWDYPGNIVRQAFHKPPALSPHAADSGGSNVRAGGGQPVSVRGQPAGAGVVLESQDRLENRSASQIDNLVVQVDGQLREPSPHQSNGAPPSLEQAVEVGLPEVRRSSRQRSNISPYQAGTGGMEPKSDKNS